MTSKKGFWKQHGNRITWAVSAAVSGYVAALTLTATAIVPRLDQDIRAVWALTALYSLGLLLAAATIFLGICAVADLKPSNLYKWFERLLGIE